MCIELNNYAIEFSHPSSKLFSIKLLRSNHLGGQFQMCCWATFIVCLKLSMQTMQASFLLVSNFLLQTSERQISLWLQLAAEAQPEHQLAREIAFECYSLQCGMPLAENRGGRGCSRSGVWRPQIHHPESS